MVDVASTYVYADLVLTLCDHPRPLKSARRPAGAAVSTDAGAQAISTFPQADLSGKDVKSSVNALALTEATGVIVGRRGGAKAAAEPAPKGANKLLVGVYFGLW